MKWVIATICEWTDILHGPIGPLNGPISYKITLGQSQTGNINPMIKLTEWWKSWKKQ